MGYNLFFQMRSLRGSDDFDQYLYALSCEPHGHNFYSQCEVNGVKYVIWERDCRSTTTQNSGVMVETDDEKYYGVVEDIIELIYPQGVTVVIFKCRWYNENRLGIRRDHGLESLDTSQSWYEDTPYCLASIARQVFYIDDPKFDDNWKVVNVVSQRGTFNANSLARDVNAYQEEAPSNISKVPIRTLHVDLGSLPRAPPDSYMSNVNYDSDDYGFEDDDEDEDANVYYENEDGIEEDIDMEDDIDDDYT